MFTIHIHQFRVNVLIRTLIMKIFHGEKPFINFRAFKTSGKNYAEFYVPSRIIYTAKQLFNYLTPFQDWPYVRSTYHVPTFTEMPLHLGHNSIFPADGIRILPRKINRLLFELHSRIIYLRRTKDAIKF